jgi:DNA-nicking Smr family endonuclease
LIDGGDPGDEEEDGDAAAFRDAVRGTRPLPDDGRAALPADRPRPKARFRRAADREIMPEAMRAGDDGADLTSGEELSFRRDHLGLKAFRRLRRGGFPIQAELDLHGLTLDQSREELKQFLAQTPLLNTICVRIITGRGLRSTDGKPVLRPAVARWLRNDPRVLAYTSARQVDGGLGAVYVLLRTGKR